MRPPGRVWLASRPAGSRLKLEARGELQPSGRPGAHGLTEERRAEVADETDVVDVVHDIEAVQGERGGGAFVFLGPDQIKVTLALDGFNVMNHVNYVGFIGNLS